MLDKLLYPRSAGLSRIIVLLLWGVYFLLFFSLYNQVGDALASLAVIPAAAGGWYFGPLAGIATSAIAILINFFAPVISGLYPFEMLRAGDLVGDSVLLIVGGIVGLLGKFVRQHRANLLELKELEKERQDHLQFISLLNEITWSALEARDVSSMGKIITERIAKLFDADDCYLALWNEETQTPLPLAAHGAALEAYSSFRFECGEPTLTRWILDTGQPLVAPDFANSLYSKMVNAKMAPFLSSAKSAFGLPLIAGKRKLGILFLTYNDRHEFTVVEINQGKLTSEQIAIALNRVQLFEMADRRVKELKILYEIAVASTQLESEDALLEYATEIIGQNLFPDNFGILLLDEKSGLLCAHPSYRVYNSTGLDPHNFVVALGEGISGVVAQSGIPQRIGDVRQVENYFNVDARTRSELCVPLKVKERVLGVINAESAELNAFTVSDETLLMTFAGQLATAIEYLRSLEAERRWMNQLARSNELISALSSIAAKIERLSNPTAAIKTLQTEFQKIGLRSLLSLYLSEEDQVVFQYASLLPESGETIAGKSPDYRVRAQKLETLFGIENVLAPMVLPDPIQTMKIILSEFTASAVSGILRSQQIAPETEIVHLPLLFEDRLLGALWLWGPGVTGNDLPIMTVFARQVAIILENARLFEETQNLALTDPLMGLYNRRGLFEIGRIEFARSRRAGRPFSAIMADLDHFKRINDHYGHFTGDRVLQNFAYHCRKSVRNVDLIGRYGGEEIVILLPETDLQTAVGVAERLKETIAGHPFQEDETVIECTASFGVAQMDENTSNLETLIARADQAMYIAKHKGRNRVDVST
jgi:diguanylate cyclase (GGDEF)-like protein